MTHTQVQNTSVLCASRDSARKYYLAVCITPSCCSCPALLLVLLLWYCHHWPWLVYKSACDLIRIFRSEYSCQPPAAATVSECTYHITIIKNNIIITSFLRGLRRASCLRTSDGDDGIDKKILQRFNRMILEYILYSVGVTRDLIPGTQ